MPSKTVSMALLASTVAAQSCLDYAIISTRGTFEIQGRSIAFTTMINQTLDAISNGVEYDTVYPAAVGQNYEVGSEDIVRYIEAGLAECPNQKFALLGYSQGASATMGALQNYTDTDSAFFKSIAAILVVGNPYHIPGSAQNVDEFDGDSTRKYPGSAYNAENENSRGIPEVYYPGAVIDICHTEDAVCAPAYPNASFVPGHLHYGDQNVQDLGGKFLISHIKAALESGSDTEEPCTTTASAYKPRGTGSSSPHHNGTYPKPSGSGYAPKPSGTGVAPSGTGVGSTPPTGSPIAPPTSDATTLLSGGLLASVIAGVVAFIL